MKIIKNLLLASILASGLTNSTDCIAPSKIGTLVLIGGLTLTYNKNRVRHLLTNCMQYKKTLFATIGTGIILGTILVLYKKLNPDEDLKKIQALKNPYKKITATMFYKFGPEKWYDVDCTLKRCTAGPDSSLTTYHDKLANDHVLADKCFNDQKWMDRLYNEMSKIVPRKINKSKESIGWYKAYFKDLRD